MLALELNDAELQLAAQAAGDSAPRLLASEAGAAQFQDGRWQTGAAAVAQSRLRPQQAFNRYWHELSGEPLGHGPQPGLCAADLAHMQLQSLLSGNADEGGQLLLAVPASLGREQVGLLLGVAAEAGAREIGLVDAALAACALAPLPPHVVHLEIHRHQALVTSIEQTVGGASRSRFELDAACGLQRFEQLWLEAAGAAFVRQTRFDPLHQSASEQALLDGLPGWLAALAEAESVSASIDGGGQPQQAELARGQMLAAVEPAYAAIQKLVQRARPAGLAIELRVGAVAQRLPGLLDRLRALSSCVVTPLPRGAAALGALQQHATILRGADTALVCQLPLAATAPLAVAPAASGEDSAATHVVFAGGLWALQAAPLTVGSEAPATGRVLLVPPGIPGVSRQHCRLLRRDGGAVVEDLSTYGTFLNEERVHGSAPLRRGDRLRLGSPGISLELVGLAEPT